MRQGFRLWVRSVHRICEQRRAPQGSNPTVRVQIRQRARMPCATPVPFASAWYSAEKLGKIILSRSTRVPSTTRRRSVQASQSSLAVGRRGCHSAGPHPSPLLSLHSLELGTATAGVRHRLSITRWEGAVSCGPGASPEPWRLDSWPAGHGCAQAVSHKAPWTMRRPPSRWGRIRMLLCNDQH